MIMCSKCGKALEDGTRFCDNCGAQISEAAACPNCGERIIPGYAFCQKCGAPVSQVPNPGAGYVPTPGAGYTPDPGTGYTPNPGTGYTPDPGTGYVPNSGTGYTPDPGTGYTPDPGTGYTPDPGTGYAPNPGAGYTPDPGTGYAPNPGAGYTPDPGTGYASYPDPGSGSAVAAPPQKKPIPKKALIFGGIGVAAVAVVVALVALIVNLVGGGSKTSDKTYMFYLKDSELVYLDVKSGDTLEVTSRLTNNSMSNSQLASNGYAFGYYIAFSEDGSKLFYPDRTDFYNAEGITLYYRNMNKPDEEPLKIDSDVTSYAINNAGTVLIYSKGRDGALYKHDLTNKDKIASDVEYFRVADDCNKILYQTEDGSLYVWTSDSQDKTKIASDVYNLEYVSDDFSVIYYTKLDSSDFYPYTYSLYKQVEGSDDREKIASEIYDVVNVYETGEVYYITSEEVTINLRDYVNDDMEAADAAITEPMYSDYQHPDQPESISWNTNYGYYSDYPSDEYPYYYSYRDYTNDPVWGEWISVYVTQVEYDAWWAQYNADLADYQAECDRLDNEYRQAQEAYWAKQSRDYLRRDLDNYSFNQREYSLYYYNGTEGTLVTDALADSYASYASGAATLLLRAYNQADVSSVRLSEIENGAYEVYERVYAALYSTSERYVAVKATLTVFDQTEADNFRISSDGSAIFFLDDIVDYSKGDLYKITVTDGQAGRPELYDSDVNPNYMYFLSDNRFVYFKDVESGKGDLYVDKTAIDYDVRPAYISTMGDAFLYYTDWNSDRSYGTLKMYSNGEKTKIADDVHDFVIVNGDDILYLYDYSSNSYKGTLYRYNNGNPVKIDEDVTTLIPVSSSKVKGSMYFYGW